LWLGFLAVAAAGAYYSNRSQSDKAVEGKGLREDPRTVRTSVTADSSRQVVKPAGTLSEGISGALTDRRAQDAAKEVKTAVVDAVYTAKEALHGVPAKSQKVGHAVSDLPAHVTFGVWTAFTLLVRHRLWAVFRSLSGICLIYLCQ
jgi:hypothetical protein